MPELGQAWNKYRKENRFLLAGFVFLLSLSAGAFYLLQRTQAASPQELTNRLLLFVLWYLDISLILVLSFILVRSLVKLIVERRAGVLGARFRTKLISTYIVLTFVPVIFIFLIATNLLQHSIDRWFSAPVEEILRGGRDLAVQLREVMEVRLQSQASLAAEELGPHPSTEQLAHLHRIMGVDLLALFRNGDLVESVSDPRRIQSTVPPLQWSQLETSGVRVERWRGGLLLRAWRPVADSDLTIVVGSVLPQNLLRHLDRTITADSEFQTMRQQKGTLTSTTVLVFLSVTLLLLFATVWMGLYLSRRFTEPLLAVADATRRVAEGDALEEVEAPASDEMAVLVDSFNAMVRRVRGTEREILASNQELATLLATIPIGVLTLSPDCARFRPNAAAARMLGNPSWRGTWQSVDSITAPGFEELFQRLQPGRPERESFQLDLTVAGDTRHLEITRRPFPGGGIVVAMDDLTELVVAQRQMAWSEVAQQIAHEIKNPLTPIRLAAERIQRRASDLVEADVNAVLSASCEAIIAHVSGLQALVDAFHEYARMPPVKPRSSRVEALVREATALYENIRPGLNVVTRTDSSPVWAAVDPMLVRQALVNLIDNAAAAIADMGRIEVHAFNDGSNTIIEVADDGPGLPTEDGAVLTRPFFSTKGRGSGMGLAIVHRIVRDHDGTLEFVNLEPHGTRVVMCFHNAAQEAPLGTDV